MDNSIRPWDDMLSALLPGEIMVGPQKVYLLDELTTGLDSSTAHQVVSAIRDFAHYDEVIPPCMPAIVP